MEYGTEPGGARLVEPGPRDVVIDPVAARARLPYPVSLAMQSGNEHSLREAARLLVEGAI